jgi:hypothetical protein
MSDVRVPPFELRQVRRWGETYVSLRDVRAMLAEAQIESEAPEAKTTIAAIRYALTDRHLGNKP